MKAITLINPWGALIAAGVKRIENRSWKPARDLIGQRIAIHAGKKIDEQAIATLLATEDDRLDEWGGARLVETPTWRATGVILCTVKLAGFVDNPDDAEVEAGEGQSWWFSGPYGFVLEDVRVLATPVPCKGALGFWPLPADIEATVVAQLGGAA